MKNNLLFISLISLILVGCSKQDDDEPNHTLEVETINFYPHDVNSNLVFKNEDDEERTLVVKESKISTVYNYTNKPRLRRLSSESRRLRLVWEENDTHGQFLIDMNVAEPDVAPYSLVDFLRINYSSSILLPEYESSRLDLDILTSNRGHNRVDYDSFWNTEEPEFREEVVISNETFSNVYFATGPSGIKLYYSAAYGILAFIDLRGDLWMFSHVVE